MAVTKAKKLEIIHELEEKIPRAKSLVFLKNVGITVQNLGFLRKNLRAENAELKVAKKTLIKKVAHEKGIAELTDDILEGPIMMMLNYGDEIAGAKVAKAFMKEHKDEKTVEFAGGLFEGKMFSKKDVEMLAGLPSKQELLAKVVGTLKSPLYGLHNALSYHLRGLVQVLAAIQKQKTA